MTDLSNYYQRDHRNSEPTPSERFPNNHVRHSALLKPLQWIDSAYGLFGSRAFMTKDAMLKEFDSAAPLDEYLGTKEELKQVRELIVSFCEGVDRMCCPIQLIFTLKTIQNNIKQPPKNFWRF